MGEGYLTRLTLTLIASAAEIPDAIRERHRDFILAQQREDGGWAGREGSSDPYYTAFGLRGLWIAGGLDLEVGQKAAEFLRRQMTGRQSVVDLMSLIFASAIIEIAVGKVVIGEESDSANQGWVDRMVALMDSMRTDDGGYAKTPEGRAGSTYQTFLTALCFELLGRDIPNPDAVANFLAGQRQTDGGYLEIRAAKRAGVNPTAAAVGTLRCIGAVESIDRVATGEFLLQRQNHNGGFAANTRIPFSDLLSTFTAIWTLAELGINAVDRLPSAGRYACSMSADAGGFVGFELDETTDVEYTFYGLGVTALVAGAVESPDP